MNSFVENIGPGNFLPALQSILQFPGISFDILKTNKKAPLHAITNYVHATVLETPGEDPIANIYTFSVYLANMFLQKTLAANPYQMPNVLEVLATLRYENELLNYVCMTDESFKHATPKIEPNILHFINSMRLGIPLDENTIEAAIASVPDQYKTCLTAQIALLQTWNKLKLQRPAFGTFIKTPPPWHPFRYPNTFSPNIPEDNETPVIFLEPNNSDYASLFQSLANKPILFVFETQIAFMQMLQFPDVVSVVKNPQNLIYILELYPNQQLLLQNSSREQWTNLRPVFYAKKKPLEEGFALFIDVLQKCLAQSPEELKNDSPLSNWLFQITKRIVFKIREEQLGRSRSPAHTNWMNDFEWYSPHKGLPPSNAQLGPELNDYFGQRLKELAFTRSPRILSKDKKIKIAHIVPQVIHIGHAPTRLLDTLLTFYDKERYEVVLICSERMSVHLSEYPYPTRVSTSSRNRANDLLHRYQAEGIAVYVADTDHSYEETANMLSTLLNMHSIDIAIFHSPDVINLLCAQSTDVPLRIVFEHGTQPSYPGFDIAIVSTQEALNIYRDLFQKFNTKAYALSFAADLRDSWTPAPPTRQELGLPLNGFFMTTISNNLDARLGNEMCLAIAEILKRCPNAYYTPIGRIFQKEKFMNFFEEHKVADRVIFLGEKERPSNIARTMNMYLNEFPFGSCLGILDAMASGCPVVTMYDEQGPQQARYGGIYYGMERAVTSGLRKDYVELACRLIQDDEVYEEWSQHALKQYEKQLNIKKYVADFEAILEQSLRT